MPISTRYQNVYKQLRVSLTNLAGLYVVWAVCLYAIPGTMFIPRFPVVGRPVVSIPWSLPVLCELLLVVVGRLVGWLVVGSICWSF
nr:hypothetical protein Q903MT_gene5109 [Picea sitchensis]